MSLLRTRLASGVLRGLLRAGVPDLLGPTAIRPAERLAR